MKISTAAFSALMLLATVSPKVAVATEEDTVGQIPIGEGDEEEMVLPPEALNPPMDEGNCPDDQRLVLDDIRAIDRCRDDDLGMAGIPLLRMVSTDTQGVSYKSALGDGEMYQGTSNPRTISNIVSKQTTDTPNARGVSDLLWGFGQFLDHDIDLTEASADLSGTAPIPIEQEDDPFWGECTEMGFDRSHYTTAGTSYRQQTNDITSCIDASAVYGSDPVRADMLRTHEDGKLKTSDDGKMLPFNDDGLANAGGTESSMYVAGDIRANEQVGLLAFHTLFMREHNRLATEIKAKYPCSTDEEIYQMARKLVGATIQIITYKEFLPALIGDTRAPDLDHPTLAYDSSVDPGIFNEFSTAAYRLGHSMLSSEFKLISCSEGEKDTVLLEEMFFKPSFFATPGDGKKVDWLLKGFSQQLAQEMDTQAIDDVRDKLFNEEHECLDLVSLNIQRGRDHGLLRYRELRQKLGLSDVTDWSQITTDTDLQQNLRDAYGTIDEIDVWVGGLAEDHEEGSMTGELFGHILEKQFTNLIKGDQYFYKWDTSIANTPGLSAIWKAKDVTLANVIEDNTVDGSCDLQDNVFFAPENKQATDPPKDGGKGSSSGDPHFKTWTGDKYDYHGECDLVLLDNPDFNNGQGMKVHIRTTRVKHFSFIEKVAVMIGDDVLEFDNDAENFLLNGVKAEENKKHHKTMLGGFVVRRDPRALSIRLQDGTGLHKKTGAAKIDLHTRKNGFPAVIVDGGSSDIFKGSLGLLGEWGTGRTLGRDGITEIVIHDKLNATEFALEWQVREQEPMLFKESRFPQFPTTCTPPAPRPQRIGESLLQAEAEEACAHWKEDKEDCIFDVLATRDVMVAQEGNIVHIE